MMWFIAFATPRVGFAVAFGAVCIIGAAVVELIKKKTRHTARSKKSPKITPIVTRRASNV